MGLARLARLPRADRRLAAEALVALALSSLAIRLLSFKRVAAIAGGWRGRRRAGVDAERIVWAVDRVADRVPWRTVCFQRGLAAQLMLRRRGLAAVLHYGVGRDEAGALAAHVWVGLDGRTVIGGAQAPRFALLASFPSL